MDSQLTILIGDFFWTSSFIIKNINIQIHRKFRPREIQTTFLCIVQLKYGIVNLPNGIQPENPILN